MKRFSERLILEELKVYLGFRHFSRHAYAFDLDWNLMKDLVLRADEVREKVLGEMKSFIEKIKKKGLWSSETLKKEVGKILSRLGLNHSSAVNMFYHQVLAQKGIPFDVKIPNKETLKALENSRKRNNLTTYKNSDELFEDLGI